MGLVGLLRRKRTVVAAFGLLWMGSIADVFLAVESQALHNVFRFGLMFTAGMILYMFRDRIIVSWAWIAIAALIVGTSSLLPEYRLIAAIPLAYLCIALGVMVKGPQLRLKNDLSYGFYIYAFPMQQLLATVGLTSAGLGVFMLSSILATFPLAAASWFLIERPTLRLKTASAHLTVSPASSSVK
ncbi:hypothetical protein NCCP1664_01810 [Zafaria cholistanensis]|uniref:Acyltransferase n=2 Tax=Zafaria cholistanensis TaxID=1682741 RepID=A0A5A7NL54_9MICC|nr:hypothetical protein NCCP1664_01810 [Zafaria cholistanensis]